MGELRRRLIGLMGGEDFLKQWLWLPVLVMVSLTLVSGLFTYIKGRFAVKASDGIMRRLMDCRCNYLQRLPAYYHVLDSY